ncbi:ImmA/IrrE family metallo-endopeptidase [bacterium]|nr:ImmA/IrrE family metallo-endopeptidase [bacterium]
MRIPWMPRKDIEDRTYGLIKKYSQEIAPIKSPPIPVDNIVERLMEYQLCYENLDDDILGCLCIKDKKVVINKQANDVRFTFTCAHEIGHWTLHQDYLAGNEKQIPLFDMEPSIICRSNGKGREEWQADIFAASLLMPSMMFRKEHLQTLDKYGVQNESLDDFLSSQLVSDLAEIFDVSKQSVKIRIEDLRLQNNQPKLF